MAPGSSGTRTLGASRTKASCTAPPPTHPSSGASLSWFWARRGVRTDIIRHDLVGKYPSHVTPHWEGLAMFRNLRAVLLALVLVMSTCWPVAPSVSADGPCVSLTTLGS